MKTMMSVDGKKILRVTEEKARQLYTAGFKFIPKSMWKEQVRDIDKNPNDDVEHYTGPEPPKKNNKMSRSTKRHLRKSNK